MNMIFYGHNKPKSGFITTMTHVGSTITIRIASGGGDIVVDWGDDSIDTYLGGILSPITHAYNTTGTYDIVLKSNDSLVELVCFSNSLTLLDTSENNALTTLSCSENDLSNLDISKSTLLNFIICYSNSLSSDVINSNLEALVSSGVVNGQYEGQTQSTTAPPTGQGLTDKATLISRGWTVITD